MSPNQEPQITPKIDNLILIDRSVDYLTPMMTQLTYEGLVDEYLGIKYSKIKDLSRIIITIGYRYVCNLSSSGVVAGEAIQTHSGR